MTLESTTQVTGNLVSGDMLREQNVVVIGGTSGMGLAAARVASEEGASVVVAGRRPESERPAIDSSAENIRHAIVDVSDEASIRTFFEQVGPVNHLFVTATPPPVIGSFLEQDLAVIRPFVEGKFFGSWACARYAAPAMPPGGSITFLTGCAAIRPKPGLATVTATFAAVESLAQSLALELGPLRVNTIRPGLIDSEMWDFMDDGARQRLRDMAKATMPVRRIGETRDIAHAALFVMTNPYVTGTVLEVSGGEPLITLDL